jgi:hypothetical protein
MGARRIRREQRRFDMDLSRRTNGLLKTAERERRAERIKGIIRASTFPYTPSIMSWLSVAMAKPASKIVQADVDALLKGEFVVPRHKR